MKLKTKPYQIKNLNLFKHTKTSDGLTYETDHFRIEYPTYLTIIDKEEDEITFNEKIKNIATTEYIKENTYELSIWNHNNNQTLFTYTDKDKYQLILETSIDDEDHIKIPTKYLYTKK